MITMELAHKAVFVFLYFLLFLSTFVFLERLLYLFFTFPAEKKLFLKEIEEEQSEEEVEAKYHTFPAKLNRGMGVLLFTITASPLLGLLGTVLGIMNSFLAMAREGVSNIVEVSKGIGFALEATALGIMVAVVSLLYYHTLNGLIGRAKTEVKVLILKGLKK